MVSEYTCCRTSLSGTLLTHTVLKRLEFKKLFWDGLATTKSKVVDLTFDLWVHQGLLHKLYPNIKQKSD